LYVSLWNPKTNQLIFPCKYCAPLKGILYSEAFQNFPNQAFAELFCGQISPNIPTPIPLQINCTSYRHKLQYFRLHFELRKVEGGIIYAAQDNLTQSLFINSVGVRQLNNYNRKNKVHKEPEPIECQNEVEQGDHTAFSAAVEDTCNSTQIWIQSNEIAILRQNIEILKQDNISCSNNLKSLRSNDVEKCLEIIDQQNQTIQTLVRQSNYNLNIIMKFLECQPNIPSELYEAYIGACTNTRSSYVRFPLDKDLFDITLTGVSLDGSQIKVNDLINGTFKNNSTAHIMVSLFGVPVGNKELDEDDVADNRALLPAGKEFEFEITATTNLIHKNGAFNSVVIAIEIATDFEVLMLYKFFSVKV